MKDFYRDQYERLFAESCRKAKLIGAITAWVEMAQSTDLVDKAITPAKAVTEIRRLLDEFTAEPKRIEAVNDDLAA